MPVSFRRLRIAGFKSFAEPVSVEIMPGLTGIVGPNGCGKSNVVEALRWAMGESNARTLRGGEMEDVIFAGTTGRASRNIAEVTIYLDETAGVAPPPFHEHPELEVIRRIERGAGSGYRINGREARARDVQTLFADLASGARASAMVSQGRVSALVGARPEERRAVLEEAAGITGLHARRHEAELKLRAAEANLARSEDLRGQLDVQLAGLKRQARQAARYRNISAAIRTAEAELLSLQRARAAANRSEAHAAMREAREAVAAAAGQVRDLGTHEEAASQALPALREAEAEARTGLERHRIALEQLAAEEQRARAALAEASRRVTQLRHDLAHAEQLRRDAATAEQRLTAEDTALGQADTGHADREHAAATEAVEAADAVQVADAEANRATEAAAAANAQAQAAVRELQQAEQQARRLNELFTRLGEERARVASQQVDPSLLERGAQEQAAAEAALVEARVTLEQAEQARTAAAATLSSAREAASVADTAQARVAAEANALAEVLAVKDGERWPPMVDALTVPSGLEAALGAVLGEELTSALDPGAARHWRELPPFDPAQPLPDGVPALAAVVEGPAALSRALSQIGLIEDEPAGEALQSRLSPGQVLVSRSGAIWRWDGYTIKAGTPTAATVRLQQRNRLAGLRKRLAVAERETAAARQTRAAAELEAQGATQAEQQARNQRRECEQRLERARALLANLRNQAATAGTRLAGVDEQLARVMPDRERAHEALRSAQAIHGALPDIGALRTEVENARRTLGAARAREAAVRSQRDTLKREHASRTQRRHAIAGERALWAERAADAAGRVNDLAARLAEGEGEQATMQAAPGQIASRRAEAEAILKEAGSEHRRSAEALAAASRQSDEQTRAARAAEAALAVARETAVRAEGVMQQADHAWGTVAERLLERFGVDPTLPEPPADLTAEAEERARRKFERQQKERDEMGPVNLRAEVEAEAIEQQITAIETDRTEIASAIAKLRGSIGHLNREGRDRLNAVFQEVDRNFQSLFARMFGGGRAHLAMVGSDDPLQAGLEIFAQPPGKKLATLSLLSGGEQALTALSLIFAVFRCNPAPVCVLDEVDAPLDDANVERFCTLLDDMVRETGTRFLVVTHHPMTMARMDRLYGVTMQERGVSRLLSVDLQRAASFVEPDRIAAE